MLILEFVFFGWEFCFFVFFSFMRFSKFVFLVLPVLHSTQLVCFRAMLAAIGGLNMGVSRGEEVDGCSKGFTGSKDKGDTELFLVFCSIAEATRIIWFRVKESEKYLCAAYLVF